MKPWQPVTFLPTRNADRRSTARVGGCSLRRILGSTLAVSLCVVGSTATLAQGAPSEPPEDRTFADQEVVTAVDLMVRLRPGVAGALKQWSRGWSLPSGVEPGDVRVEVAGREVPVVAVEEIVDGRPTAMDPWQQVIVVDVQGSRTRDLAVALDLLTQQVDDLIELGDVSVFLRRDRLELVQTATRDGETLSRVLSQLALTVEGEDELGDARYGVRRELLDQSWDRGAANRRLAKALSLERSRVLRHQDQLLLLAADSSFATSPRRALYWLSAGFDLEPELFYDIQSEPQPGAAPQQGRLEAVRTADQSRGFSATLAAYGWIVVPLAPDPPDPLRGKGPGVRLGKWRLHGLRGTYEAERRPDRAAAYLELGAAHVGAGRYEDAAEALDRAYYHYWGDPRTAPKQAEALVHLGEAKEHLAEKNAARTFLEMAVELDRGVAESVVRSGVERRAAVERWAIRDTGSAPGRLSVDDRLRFVAAPLNRPEAPLQSVAEATSGRRVKARRDWTAVADDLRLRLRLTVQVPGQASGELQSVALQWQGENSASLAGRSWIRSGVPRRLTEALGRLSLVEEPSSLGAAPGWAAVEPLGLEAGSLRLRVTGRDLPDSFSKPIRWLAVAGGDGAVPRSVTVLQSEDEPPPTWTVDVHEPYFVVLWQEVGTGRWGAERHTTGLE